MNGTARLTRAAEWIREVFCGKDVMIRKIGSLDKKEIWTKEKKNLANDEVNKIRWVRKCQLEFVYLCKEMIQ